MPRLTRLLILALLAAAPQARCQEGGTVKVFVLAGQSNMEGKAKNSLLEHQAQAAETREMFAHLRRDGAWIERDDAYIKFLERHGRLTLGYGSRDRTGMELEFGTVLAEHFEEPVLLIKTAWGGHSLFKLFRPPSAGMPAEEVLQEELRKAQEAVRNNNEKNGRQDPLPTLEEITSKYGESYRNMLREIESTRENLGELFPALAGKKLEFTGFVWFQGWNDQYGAENEYAENMRHLIRDIRRDLQAPRLPVVICMMGQNGSRPAQGAMLTIQQAQQSMETLPEFQGAVKAVRTDVLVDKAAEELFPTWRDNIEQWEKTGSDFPYHYLGSAIWFHRIGRASADAMLELLGSR